MKATLPVLVLGLANLGLAGLLVANAAPVGADDGVLRGRAIELVDAAGRPRFTVALMPAADGRPETVLLRLIDGNGQPSVKIGADGTSAGISLVGGDDASYVIVEANGGEAALKLNEAGGAETISP